MSTERARTLCAQAVDEIAATYTLLKRILSELEDTLVKKKKDHLSSHTVDSSYRIRSVYSKKTSESGI
jgi:hypothetical protein